jgi:hypothetical protein
MCLETYTLAMHVGVRVVTHVHFQQYFSYIVTVSFIGEGNQSTGIKPPNCRLQVTDKLYHHLNGDISIIK